MLMIGGKRHGFEFKYTDAPGRKRSMRITINDLGLEHLWIIYPGDQRYALAEKITVIPMEELSNFFGSSPKELIQIKDSRIPGVQGSSEMT